MHDYHAVLSAQLLSEFQTGLPVCIVISLAPGEFQTDICLHEFQTSFREVHLYSEWRVSNQTTAFKTRSTARVRRELRTP